MKGERTSRRECATRTARGSWGPRISISIGAVALWSALVVSAVELATVSAQLPVFGRFAFVGGDVWWTLPLVNVLLFGGVAVFLAAGRLVMRRGEWWLIGLWLYAFMGAMAVLYYFPELHRLAAVLLAAGMATQAARVAARRAGGFSRLIRRTTPGLVILALAAAGVVRGGALWRERRALADLPAARPDAPNVLLIVLDTVRARSLGLHGYDRATSPRLEAWASRGVSFANAFSTSPWTLPSHASMLTGRWEHELSTDWTRPLDGTHPTLAEALASLGYATAGIVANTDYASREVGLGRGFAYFEDYVPTPGLILRSAALGRAIGRTPLVRATIGTERALGRKEAPEITASFLEWIDRRQSRPWFAMLNYYDAHRPYQPPEPFYTKFATTAVPPDPRVRQNDDPADPWTADDAARFITAYDGALAYLDAEIGAMLDAIARRGQLDRTLIVITSDHGEEFGEHGLYDHGNSLYLPAIHVPLVLIAPGWIPPGTVVRHPVSLRDIPATILGFVKAGSAASLPGRSLARHWLAPESPATEEVVASSVRRVIGQPPSYPASRGDVISFADESLRYIRNLGDGAEELFNYRVDPEERDDLSRRTEYGEALRTFRGRANAVRRVVAMPLTAPARR